MSLSATIFFLSNEGVRLLCICILFALYKGFELYHTGQKIITIRAPSRLILIPQICVLRVPVSSVGYPDPGP
jgi:hypothetical protein